MVTGFHTSSLFIGINLQFEPTSLYWLVFCSFVPSIGPHEKCDLKSFPWLNQTWSAAGILPPSLEILPGTSFMCKELIFWMEVANFQECWKFGDWNCVNYSCLSVVSDASSWGWKTQYSFHCGQTAIMDDKFNSLLPLSHLTNIWLWLLYFLLLSSFAVNFHGKVNGFRTTFAPLFRDLQLPLFVLLDHAHGHFSYPMELTFRCLVFCFF